MATNRINIRLNEVKDKDIIDALDNAKDLTKEVKKLLRRGMSGTVILNSGESANVEVRAEEFIPAPPPTKPRQEKFEPIAEEKQEPPVVLAEKQLPPTPIPAPVSPVQVKPVAQKDNSKDDELINNFKSNF